MNDLIDSKLVSKLRKIIINNPFLGLDVEYKDNFNLICAFMDQFDNTAKYLNSHQNFPLFEDEIILLFHHFCIIRDGIKAVSKILSIENKSTNIFQSYCEEIFSISLKNYKGDDKFFDYLRSLFVAHQFITDRSIPNPIKGEIQYSPYILNDKSCVILGFENSVGVVVYSNKRNMFYICIKFEDLKKYIKLKFEKINDIINYLQCIVNNKIKEWSKRKVNRNQDSVEILLDVMDVLKERYLEYLDIKEIYNYLTCSISDNINREIINKYRKLIVDSIPAICDCIDDMNYDKLDQIISSLRTHKIKSQYEMMDYQLEKIYSYLDDDIPEDKVSIGLLNANLFSEEFAKDWVNINTGDMSFIEIKLLVTIACYYQAQKEESISE